MDTPPATRMQNMLPSLEQRAANPSQLDDDDARRLARWAEVVTWLVNESTLPSHCLSVQCVVVGMLMHFGIHMIALYIANIVLRLLKWGCMNKDHTRSLLQELRLVILLKLILNSCGWTRMCLRFWNLDAAENFGNKATGGVSVDAISFGLQARWPEPRLRFIGACLMVHSRVAQAVSELWAVLKVQCRFETFGCGCAATCDLCCPVNKKVADDCCNKRKKPPWTLQCLPLSH